MSAVASLPTRVAAPAAPPRGAAHDLTGTGHLVRFVLRRDRVRLAVWAASVVLLHVYFVGALSALYTTRAERQSRAALMESPVSTMMAGPGYGLDDYTVGAMLSNELIGWVAIALAVFSVLQVVRSTRAEEESGRAELVRAGVVGRLAPEAAAFVVVGATNGVMGLLSALVMVGGGLEVADSLAIGASYALVGLVFTAVGVVVAQVTEHARGATGLGLAVLGVVYMARAFGDMQQTHGSWLSWTSPIGWAQQMRAFVDLRWWPLALHAALVVLLLGVAVALASRRDVGAGLVAPRAGRADAAPSLRSPFALAWRQQRVALVWWSVGLGLMWTATGTYLEGVEEMFAEVSDANPEMLALFGGNREQLLGGFLAVSLLFGMLLAAGYGVAAVLRARTEEAAGRLEPVLGLPVSRTRWLAAQLGVAALGTAVLAAVTAVTLWLGAVTVGVTDPGFGTYLAASAAYLPALAVYLGATAALYAWLPRAAALPWALLAIGFVVGVFGPLLDVPEAVAWLDPFHAVPRVPVEDVTAGPLLALAAVAAVLWALAFVGFRRRGVPAA